jgi:hypothetical protein
VLRMSATRFQTSSAGAAMWTVTEACIRRS